MKELCSNVEIRVNSRRVDTRFVGQAIISCDMDNCRFRSALEVTRDHFSKADAEGMAREGAEYMVSITCPRLFR